MISNRFKWFIHNCVAHPLMGIAGLLFGDVPAWMDRFHDWTMEDDA